MGPPSKPLPVNQKEFELAVFENCISAGLIDGRLSESAAAIARKQFAAASVRERWGSGAGFYTWYEIPTSIERLPPGTILETGLYVLRGIEPNIDQLLRDGLVPNAYAAFGAGNAYFDIYDGRINHLDAHCYGRGWPEDFYEFWFFDNEASN